MKRTKYSLPALILVAGCVTVTGCLKKFDPDSYMPPKSFGGYNSSAEIAPSDLVAYWSFNGDLSDSAGNLNAANHGTTFTSGIKGQALQVGADHYLVFDDPGTVIPALQSYTIAFWMNAPQNTSYGYGVFSLANAKDFWGSLDIYLDNGSTPDTAQFKVHMNNANAKNTGQFQGVKMPNAFGQWVHVAVTYDGASAFNIYENGQSVYSATLKDGTDNYGPLLFVNATAMVIGTWQFETDPSLTASAGEQSWAGSFGGALDEFRIYDKALPAGDIKSLYQLEKAGR